MKPVLMIPARLNASRLPGKPLADICGKPMIVRVWEKAVEADLGPVVVACDDPSIARVVEDAGGKACKTPSDLPSGSDRAWHALQQIDPEGHHDAVVLVQGDLPLIDPNHIRVSLEPLLTPETHIATLATEIKAPEEKSDPNVVKIALAQNSPGTSHPLTRRALYFSRSLIPSGVGPHYHHVGLYAYRRDALKKFVTLPPSSLEQQEKLEQLRALEAGLRIDVRLIEGIPLGVDTEKDLEQARLLIRGR